MPPESRHPKDPARSGCRRAHGHDYSSVCKYMITINKNPEVPPFSTVEGDLGGGIQPYCRYTPAGMAVNRVLSRITREFPQCSIDRRLLMPDHIHFIISVNEYLHGFTLSKIINMFMGRCTAELMAEGLIASGVSTYTRGFNDKILLHAGQLRNWANYILDNPRRYLIKRKCREYFGRRQILDIDGVQRTIYGNFMLLREPLKVPGIVSSRYTPQERLQHEHAWAECMRTQGVMVSPFISRPEKELYRRAIDSGCSLILIVKEGLPERYKPYGEQFELCSLGRLLIVAAPEYDAERKALSRCECMDMNRLARRICALGNEEMRLKRPV